MRGDETAQREDAVRRLAAREFDDSVDRSSIGQRSFDALEGSNEPYEIDDEAVLSTSLLPRAELRARRARVRRREDRLRRARAKTRSHRIVW